MIKMIIGLALMVFFVMFLIRLYKDWKLNHEVYAAEDELKAVRNKSRVLDRKEQIQNEKDKLQRRMDEK